MPDARSRIWWDLRSKIRACTTPTIACATLLTFTTDPMKLFSTVFLFFALLLSGSSTRADGNSPASSSPVIFGFRAPTAEQATELRFLAVPDSRLAEEHLRILTKVPHMAGTLEDKATADYVARTLRAAA